MHPNASMKYNRRYKDFNEFCEYIKTPEEVLNWYKINKIRWNKLIDDEFYKKPINWPDVLIKEKEGNCFDHAIFMHYFCEKYNIENCIVRFVRYSAKRNTSKWHFCHHFVSILKIEAGWVIFDYDSLGGTNGIAEYNERAAMKSSLVGPFKTKEDAAKYFTDYYMRQWKQYNSGIGLHWMNIEKAKPETIFLNDKVMKTIDRLYGDRSFTQEEFYNLVKGEMGDTRYEGRDYEYDGFFDKLSNEIIVGINKIRNFREEGNIMNESKKQDIIYTDKYGNVKAKGDSTYVGMDNNADESTYTNKVKYVVLKANGKVLRGGKPQPVIEMNGGQYRARCEVLVLKGNQVLLDRGKDRGGFGYSLPGGGLDSKESIAHCAMRECEEEALVKPKKIKYVNIVWWADFDNVMINKGAISFICVAEYGGDYKDKVKNEDKDEFADRARWEDYRTADLGEPHKLAIQKYLGKNINEEVRMWGYEIRAMTNASIRLLEMSGGGGPMIGMEINDQSVQYSCPGQFIITTKDKDSGIDYGVTNDIKSKYLYRKDKNKGYVKEDMESYLNKKDYKIYQYTGDINIWKYMLNDIYYNSYDEDTTIYEDLTGRKQLTEDQIDFDENFRYYNIKQVLLESSILNATAKSKLDELKGKKTHLFDTDIKVSDKFSVAEGVKGYCLRYGDYHSNFVSLDELAKIYNI